MLSTDPSGIWKRLRALAARLPSQCAICHAWPAQRICAGCAARFAQPQPRCTRCALAVPPDVSMCGACLRDPAPLDACLTAVDYAYPWAMVLSDFKFRAEPGWAAALAALLRSTPCVEAALQEAYCVIPIPLSRERLRERGFNQAVLVAQQLARQKTDATLLLRLRSTETQSALPRAQRLRNLEGAFAVEPTRAFRLAGQRVVLVDDVMTTGATLQAAAQVLREAGAAHITAIVVARTERNDNLFLS